MVSSRQAVDVDLDTEPDAKLSQLVDTADEIGAMVQYKSPGFLRNWRQYRQFGLAVLQMAQVRRRTLTHSEGAARH